MDFIDLNKQYLKIKEPLSISLKRIFTNSDYILGKEVIELEQQLSEYTQNKCITVANGTDALFVALKALDIGIDDEVIVPSFTWVSSVETILSVGAVPIYCDIDPFTFNLDLKDAQKKISSKTRAIMAVSIFGQTADLFDAKDLCKKNGIYLIEDGAQSFGAEHFGHKSCSIADISTTSFFPSKPLGCYGDGGAIFWKNNDFDDLLKTIPRHGQTGRYDYKRVGINSRLDTIQAAVLIEKLKIFEGEIELRNDIAKLYERELNNVGSIQIPKILDNNRSVFAQYTIKLIDLSRNELIEFLKKKDIPTGVYYSQPLHLSKPYESNVELPNTMNCSKNVLSLPMSPYLEKKEVEYICSSIKEFVY